MCDFIFDFRNSFLSDALKDPGCGQEYVKLQDSDSERYRRQSHYGPTYSQNGTN